VIWFLPLANSLSVLTALAKGVQRLKDVPGRDSVVTFAAAAQTQDETRFLPVAQTKLELNAPDRALSVSRRLSPRAHSGCRANWKLDQAFSIAADR
jgi:hypothetical protein